MGSEMCIRDRLDTCRESRPSCCYNIPVIRRLGVLQHVRRISHGCGDLPYQYIVRGWPLPLLGSGSRDQHESAADADGGDSCSEA